MMSQSFLDAIQRAVEAHQTDIIILDPLISFHGQDENSNDQMRRLLDQVAIFTESLGASPLLIHHHGSSPVSQDLGEERSQRHWRLVPNTWNLHTTRPRSCFPDPQES
jgi:RecA-family ATPase